MYTYRIYLDGGNLVIGTYESNVLKGEAKHLPRGLVAVAGNTNTTITLNRVVNNLPTLANIEHPDLRDSNGNVWGANRTAVIAAINSFIQSTGGGNVISVNGQTGTVSLGLQNLVNVTTITPTQGDVLSYNSSGNWVLNSGLQYLLSKVKSATATQTSLEVDNDYKINIDATQGKTTIVHAGSSVATFGAQKALLPGVTVGTTGNTYDLPAARGTATGQVPVFNASNNTTSFQAVKVADLSGSTDDLAQGATNLFFTSAEQSKLAGIQSGAEVNVNADWNSSSGDSQILNKPTLSTVATSGSYNDLSNLPSIPAAYTDSDVDNHLNTATATTGQILSWTGSDYDWVLDAAGAPAGTVGQLQYNNSGIFGASSNLFWDISNNRLGIGTSTPLAKLGVVGKIALNDGNSNIGIGDSALGSLSTSTNVIGIGINAGTNLSSSSTNVFIGNNSGSNRSSAVIIGHGSGAQSSGSGLICIGHNNFTGVNNQPNNIVIGNNLLQNANHSLYSNIFIGGGGSNWSSVANSNVVIGHGSAVHAVAQVERIVIVGQSIGYPTTYGDSVSVGAIAKIGRYSVMVGSLAGTANSSNSVLIGYEAAGTSNSVFVGYQAGKGASSTGTGNHGVGYQALLSYTTGANNTAFGYQALKTLTAGNSNTAVGHSALLNTTGSFNVGVGELANSNSTGSYNIGIGYEALIGDAAATFSQSIGIGFRALQKLTTGNDNVALGYNAANNLTTGVQNVIIGSGSGESITTQRYNIFIGYKNMPLHNGAEGNIAIGTNIANSASADISSNNVLIGNEVARYADGGLGSSVLIGTRAGEDYGDGYLSVENVGIGYQALRYADGRYNVSLGAFAGENASGANNGNLTALGHAAGQYARSTNNTLVGAFAGQGSSVTANNTFTNTVAVGYQALTALTTGANNTAIGYQAGLTLTTNGNNTFLGYQAGNNVINSANVMVGYRAGDSLNQSGGGFNVIIGSDADGAAQQNVTIGALAYGGGNAIAIGLRANTGVNAVTIGMDSNAAAQGVVIGYEAGRYTSGTNNTVMGYQAARGVSATSTFPNTVAIGYQALTALTTGTQNTAIGYQAASSVTTSGGGTFVGYQAGQNRNRGSEVAIGRKALQNTGGGFYQVAIGDNAGQNGMGSYDIAIGWYAGAGAASGGFNIKIGETAGRFHTGTGCIIIGGSSLLTGTSSNVIAIGGGINAGSNTISIGYQSGNSNSTSSIFIGPQAGQNETGSNKLYIENSNSATPLIYGEFDTDLVRINGSFEVTSTTTSAGLYASNQTELRLYELTANGTNYIALKAAGTLAGNTTYTLPTADGSAGQTLTTDASGNMSWEYPKAPVKSEAGTAYTLVLADAGKYIRMTATTAITITIPQDIFAVGDEFFFEQNNTGQVTVAAGTGVTLRNTAAFLAKTAEQYAIIGLKCVASNEFILTGERELA